MPNLSVETVRSYLTSSVDAFPHAACFTCECFLGLVVQLRIDSVAEARPLLDEYKVEKANMHACLGCDPCPPGEKYAEYMRNRPQKTLLTL
jgi:hypothetical protein